MPVVVQKPVAQTPLEIWHIPTTSDPAQLIKLDALLSPDEQQRAKRTVRMGTRNTYITSHAALRQILGQYLELAPQEISFINEPNGKPAIKQFESFHFSLSHTQDYTLLAISSLSPVGIDIEITKQTRDILSIAKRFFSNTEYEWLSSTAVEQRYDCFYQLWCHKEAYLKALGLGLQGGLSSFSLYRDDLTAHSKITDRDKQDWWLQALNVPSPYRAAVAIAHPDTTPEIMHWKGEVFFK